jgi:hypothetical protein
VNGAEAGARADEIEALSSAWTAREPGKELICP